MYMLLHAFITSHLDYGNSLLSDLSTRRISGLQLLQNSASMCPDEAYEGGAHYTYCNIDASDPHVLRD